MYAWGIGSRTLSKVFMMYCDVVNINIFKLLVLDGEGCQKNSTIVEIDSNCGRPLIGT